MKPSIKLIVTAGGAPQASTLIRHLKDNGEADVTCCPWT